jgi:hypothetical protein
VRWGEQTLAPIGRASSCGEDEEAIKCSQVYVSIALILSKHFDNTIAKLVAFNVLLKLAEDTCNTSFNITSRVSPKQEPKESIIPPWME